MAETTAGPIVRDARHAEALRRLVQQEAERGEQAERASLQTTLKARALRARIAVTDRVAAVREDFERQLTERYSGATDSERGEAFRDCVDQAVAKARTRIEVSRRKLGLSRRVTPQLSVDSAEVRRQELKVAETRNPLASWGPDAPPTVVEGDRLKGLRAPEFGAGARRAELIALAKARIDELERAAAAAVESAARDGQRRLERADPFSAEAQALAKSLPATDELIPMLDLGDLEQTLETIDEEGG